MGAGATGSGSGASAGAGGGNAYASFASSHSTLTAVSFSPRRLFESGCSQSSNVSDDLCTRTLPYSRGLWAAWGRSTTYWSRFHHQLKRMNGWYRFDANHMVLRSNKEHVGMIKAMLFWLFPQLLRHFSLNFFFIVFVIHIKLRLTLFILTLVSWREPGK